MVNHRKTKKKSKNKIPQFTVTIVVTDEAPLICLNEDATLADARKEILLESEDFPNLPINYYFSHDGTTPFSLRKEHLHTVRELTGSDSD